MKWFARFTRPATAGLGVVLLLVLSAAPALAASASNPDEYLGYSGMYNNESAGSYHVTGPDGSSILSFCADVNIDLDHAATFTTVSASSHPGATAAAYVAVHHADLGTQLDDASAEAAATQLIVWHLLNGLEVTPSTTPYEPVYTRAMELMDAYAAAGSPTLDAGPSVYDLSLDASADGSQVTFTALFTADGLGVEGRQVLFAAEDGSSTSVTTDANGYASLTVDANGSTVLTRTASASGLFPAGTLLIAENGSQPQITAEPFSETLSASASATLDPGTPTTAPPATTPTTAPPVTPPATAPVDNELPYTGGGMPLWLALIIPLGLAAGLRLFRHGIAR